MKKSQYEIETEVESTHWWYENRRRLFADILRQLNIPLDAALLDAGCGTGANLRLFLNEGYHNLNAFDCSEQSVSFCQIKGFSFVKHGYLESIPFAENCFDLVFSTDTFGYLDARVALAELYRVLRPHGRLVITAPALQCLWGQNDDFVGHKHRYAKEEMQDLLVGGGYHVEQLYYFNYQMFLPIYLLRRLVSMTGLTIQSESTMTPGVLNRILSGVFYVDIKTASKLQPPFGVSLLAISRKG